MSKGDNCEMYRKLHLKVITLGDYSVGKSAVIPGVDLGQLGRCGMPVTATEVQVRAKARRDGVAMAIWDTCGRHLKITFKCPNVDILTQLTTPNSFPAKLACTCFANVLSWFPKFDIVSQMYQKNIKKINKNGY